MAAAPGAAHLQLYAGRRLAWRGAGRAFVRIAGRVDRAFHRPALSVDGQRHSGFARTFASAFAPQRRRTADHRFAPAGLARLTLADSAATAATAAAGALFLVVRALGYAPLGPAGAGGRCAGARLESRTPARRWAGGSGARGHRLQCHAGAYRHLYA